MLHELEGEITGVEGTDEKPLRTGHAVTLMAGTPVGDHLYDRSNATTRCLVVGTRAPVDRITYSEHDRWCIRDRSLPDAAWTNLTGDPAGSPCRWQTSRNAAEDEDVVAEVSRDEVALRRMVDDRFDFNSNNGTTSGKASGDCLLSRCRSERRNKDWL
jgi:hypothetical protein